jgi:multidrug efflux pump
VNLITLFLHRPVATTLLTLGLVLAGVLAFPLLPVAPIPQVDFPTIAVSANLPGASPATLAATVATPLERQLSRIAGITEMTSQSSLGSTQITLQFVLDRDIDGAARDVQAAINAARSQLPANLPSNPIYRKLNPADTPILVLALTSEVKDRGQMYDAASTIVAQKLSQVKGVGQVTIGGSSLPAVRVELNPTVLNRYGIGLEDVRAVLAGANANRPKGAVEDGARHWQIAANDQARTADAYRNLILTTRNGAPVRLADVGQVTDSVQDLRNAGLSNNRPAVLIMVNRQPGANIIATVERVKSLLPMLRASIPAEIDMEVVIDRTPTIRASLFEAERSLLLSVALVVLVVFLFLRSGPATLIPAVAVPVSLIGTLAVMYLCGYSLDNLSLMALTIATGFVVDDAIVVLENISRYRDAGMAPFAAAARGAREVAFTVLSMSLSLVAVFIPILLMGGIVGRLFREFAVTLSVAVLLSLIVSLTTTPMMCARLLRREAPEEARGGLYRALGRGFAWLQRGYERSLATALRHPRLMMLLLAATVGLNVVLYVICPKGLFPMQDTGRIMGAIQADQGISFQAMSEKLAALMEIVGRDPGVETIVGFTGGGQRNTGMIFGALKPVGERPPVEGVIARLRPQLAKVPGATLYLRPPQDIRMGGRSSNAEYQYTLQDDDLDELQVWTPRVMAALRLRPELLDVNSDQQNKGMQTSLTIDRATAARLGVAPLLLDQTLYDAFGQRQISTIYAQLNQYHVVMEVDALYQQGPHALNDIHVRSPAGQQIPLVAISQYAIRNTSLAVNHQGQSVAATISFNLRPGKALSDAVEVIRDTMAELGTPESLHGSFQSTARAFQESLESQPWLILAALVTVYIVLGVLYESYVHPLTILSTLPSAGVGAILALLVCGEQFNIIALIGVILLIGIVKKNAIMMIDVAVDTQRAGRTPEEAIFHACLLRFRPILMTTLAALLGALPLALGIGDGAELRRPLGISIVGGLMVSQCLTLYTTPVVYLYLERFRRAALRFFHGERAPDTPRP